MAMSLITSTTLTNSATTVTLSGLAGSNWGSFKIYANIIASTAHAPYLQLNSATSGYNLLEGFVSADSGSYSGQSHFNTTNGWEMTSSNLQSSSVAPAFFEVNLFGVFDTRPKFGIFTSNFVRYLSGTYTRGGAHGYLYVNDANATNSITWTGQFAAGSHFSVWGLDD